MCVYLKVFKVSYSSTFQITAEGHLAILSAPWYLNYLKYGSDWVKFYNVDPLDFGGNSTQAEFVLGGEVRKNLTIHTNKSNQTLQRVFNFSPLICLNFLNIIFIRYVYGVNL